MTVQAVVFDIGNVLLKFDYYIAARRLAERNKLSELPAREPIVEVKQRYEGGQISRWEFLASVMPAFRDPGPPEEFVAIWQDIFEPNTPMVDFARSLHGRIPLYLLSNIGCIHREFIFERYPFFGLFQGGVYSYEEKSLKPERRIFEVAIQRYALDPSRTLYIDDLEPNIAQAQDLGFFAIQYDHTRHDDFLHACRGIDVPASAL